MIFLLNIIQQMTYEANTKFRNYEQHVFDENKATYFINDDGYPMLRIGSEYTYNSKDGATANWTP